MKAERQKDLTIGLCLSGGGFRASFYALGILRYLAEAKLLDRVVAVSAVSGGSIAAAAVADRWGAFQDAGGDVKTFVEQVDAPFRRTVTTKNLRRRWVLGSIASVVPFTGGRGGALGRTLAHNLYDHKLLAELPAKPEFMFQTTDLTTGRAFWAARGYIGSWDYGYIEPTPTSVRLARAVAASAAFPPSLTVVRLPTKGLAFPKGSPPKQLSLVDGGVYDNMGLEWFQGWEPDALRPTAAVKPNFLVIANASGILERKDKRFRPFSAVMRELSIQYQQVLAVRIRWRYATLQNDPKGSVYMAIKDDVRKEDHAPGLIASALPSELVPPLALLRTDLDRFDPLEANLLSYHAYWTLHVRLSSTRPELALADPSWTEYANLSPAEIEKDRTLVEIGSHRFFRRILRLKRRFWSS
jgi:predicted acylesterase/phospholipase RssA